jgi:hypothetical protein
MRGYGSHAAAGFSWVGKQSKTYSLPVPAHHVIFYKYLI